MTAGFRWLLKTARLVHLIVSMMGMLVILFFAVTGLLLNHEEEWEWLRFGNNETTISESMPSALLKEVKAAAVEPMAGTEVVPSTAAKLAELKLVEFLRSHYDLRGEAQPDFNPDTARILFKAPGRMTMAAVDLDTGKLDITIDSKGLMGKMLDLHRGQSKGTGWIWSILLDATCVLLVALSITGLVIWSSLRTRRMLGMLALLGGISATLVVYFVWVP